MKLTLDDDENDHPVFEPSFMQRTKEDPCCAANQLSPKSEKDDSFLTEKSHQDKFLF